jgi:hypothetical protein
MEILGVDPQVRQRITISKRSLAAAVEGLGYHLYEVLKLIAAEVGLVAPMSAFGSGADKSNILKRWGARRCHDS